MVPFNFQNSLALLSLQYSTGKNHFSVCTLLFSLRGDTKYWRTIGRIYINYPHRYSLCPLDYMFQGKPVVQLDIFYYCLFQKSSYSKKIKWTFCTLILKKIIDLIWKCLFRIQVCPSKMVSLSFNKNTFGRESFK